MCLFIVRIMHSIPTTDSGLTSAGHHAGCTKDTCAGGFANVAACYLHRLMKIDSKNRAELASAVCILMQLPCVAGNPAVHSGGDMQVP